MNTTLNKSDLIKALADRTGIPQIKAGAFLHELIEEIQSQVAHGNTINIKGFGAFSSKARFARAGRNPATGESIQIPASVVPSFKAGAEFKAAVAK